MFSRPINAIDRMIRSASQTYTSIENTVTDIGPLMFPREHWGTIAAASGISLASSGLDALAPFVLAQAVTMSSNKQTYNVMGVDITPLTLIFLYGVIKSTNDTLTQYRNFLLTPVAPEVSKDLVIEFLDNEVKQSLESYEAKSQGDRNNLLARCYNAPQVLAGQFHLVALPTLTSMGTATGILASFFGLEVTLGLLGTLGSYAWYSKSTNSLVTKLRSDMVEFGFKAYGSMVRTTDQYKIMHLFGRVEDQLAQLRIDVEKAMEADIKGLGIIPKIAMKQAVIADVGFTGICMIVANEVWSGFANSSRLLFLTNYLGQFTGPLAALGTTINNLAASVVELRAVLKEIKKKSNIIDAHPDVPLVIEGNAAEVKFEEVSLSYKVKVVPKKEEKKSQDEIKVSAAEEKKQQDAESVPLMKEIKVLEKASFTIGRGQFVGIVGPSGAGKSSIMQAMFRLIEQHQGRILIDGKDTRQVSIKSLRQVMSVVPQSPDLFPGTIYDNIAYGAACKLSEVKREDVERVVDIAGLRSTIEALPNGLDTILGEKGDKISGGQKQRVAIARALLKNPKILILDEPTAALDAKTEAEFMVALKSLAKATGVTVILITHRLATLDEADILVLDMRKKIIAEQGKHQQLIAIPDGIYAGLWKNQVENPPSISDEQKDEMDDGIELEVKVESAVNVKTQTVPDVSVVHMGMFAGARAAMPSSEVVTIHFHRGEPGIPTDVCIQVNDGHAVDQKAQALASARL